MSPASYQSWTLTLHDKLYIIFKKKKIVNIITLKKRKPFLLSKALKQTYSRNQDFKTFPQGGTSPYKTETITFAKPKPHITHYFYRKKLAEALTSSIQF